jgi:uncharacterized protein YbjT (DUF2867 family)
MSGALVLIIGGTRSTGLLAAQLLRSRGERVRVLARDPHAAAQRLGAGVEIIRGDLTNPASLNAAFRDVGDVIFTAGVRSGRFARRSVTRATEYDGVLHTLAAAHSNDFSGRFVYMTSVGVRRRSFFVWGLNLWKGGTIHWRHLAEDAIRSCGLDYTIVRAAFLLNRPARQREVIVRQTESRLTFHEAIARADVAEALVEAVCHRAASRATLEVAWGDGPRTSSWTELFDGLKPDSTAVSAAAIGSSPAG